MRKPFHEPFPVKFPQANKNLLKPDEMDARDCDSIYVFTDGNQCVSCWHVPFLARLSILFHGNIWLFILSGSTEPPAYLCAEKTVFKEG